MKRSRSTWPVLACLISPVVAGSCGAQQASSRAADAGQDLRPAQPAQPAGWADGVRPREAVDVNPHPSVVEIHLDARVASVEFRSGISTESWTYDGGVPGPLIRVRRGNRLIVHFTNRLPEPTTIHWHGLRVPVEMDGAPHHPVPPIPAGATFDYDFVVPDAGTFWYHPHVHSAAQVGAGLYGPLVVEDPTEPAGIGDELVLVLSDVQIDGDGKLGPADSGGDLGTLFGREGNVLLVNGRNKPTLLARAGLRQRWRIINAARSRYFELRLAGHEFVRIGGDGGLLPAPVAQERLVVIPGERADVLITADGVPGTDIPLEWIPHDRGWGSVFAREPEDLMILRLTEEPPSVSPPLPDLRRQIRPLELGDATPVEIRLTQNKIDGRFALGINEQPFDQGVPIHARVGETQVWTVLNTMDWAHPFHLHGFFFQVLDDQNRPVEPLEWKDTANVPTRKQLRLAVRYDDRPGMWMFHCHILDHADAGMMGMVHLER